MSDVLIGAVLGLVIIVIYRAGRWLTTSHAWQHRDGSFHVTGQGKDRR